MDNDVELNKKQEILNSVKQWTIVFLIAIFVAYITNVFVFERAQVDGDSMLPTLRNGESLFVFKTGYLFTSPKRGDVVVFEHKEGFFKSKFIPIDPSQENYVKRVIGLPGETIDIVDGNVYINERLLVEPYLNPNTITDLGQINGLLKNEKENQNQNISFPYTIPDNCYFLMGDNRSYSLDSRSFGAVEKGKIRGKVLSVMFPFDSIRTIKNKSAYFYDEK